MPELPDVAGFKQYLDDTAMHKTIGSSHVADKRILNGISTQKLARTLKDGTLDATRRHGKHLFARLRDRDWLVMHFGMTGGLTYFQNDAPAHAKVVLDFTGGDHLAYTCRRMLGHVGITEDVDAYIERHELGPDALEGDFDAQRLIELLSGRRGIVKSMLMNQSLIAGIGNVYADEILFQTGLDPRTCCDQLDTKQIKTLFRTMRRVLRVAANKGGNVDRLPKNYLIPRRSTDQPCPTCGGEIKKIKTSGRTSYFCPKCQKQGG